jgi:hypothetical protein
MFNYGVGTFEGNFCIIKRGEMDSWSIVKNIKFGDKAITGAIILDTTIVISSEDRRLSFFSLITG